MSTISIRLSEELERRLDEEARAAHKRRSEVVRDALSEYIERRERDRLRAEIGAAARALATEPAAQAEVHRIAEEFAASDRDALRIADPPAGADEKWWD